ncbi:MAG: CoA-binding protein, partial [Myxococcota bacterium]|nr:CoA-binding protein [Myxococcota bacterium]
MSDPADGAHCPMPDRSRDDQVRAWLGQPRVVAVVGMSPKSSRPSNEVGLYLAEVGFTAIPVHPRAAEIGGLRAYPDRAAIPTPPPRAIGDRGGAGERPQAVVE